MSIPIIDLFAGPGGLGEGFSSIFDEDGKRVFDIKLSIEKDEHAHKTLRLRSFFRQFPPSKVPELYYDYVKVNEVEKQKELLEEIKVQYPKEWKAAEEEAWHFELPYPLETKRRGEKYYTIGYTDEQIIQRHNLIDERIEKSLKRIKDFLLIGGPPCQAYSVVGRARNKGISKEDHRVHLYKEYLRIIAKHQPAVFVMENVKGLLSAEIDDVKVFDLIRADLQNPDRVFPDLKSKEYKIFSFVKTPDEFDEKGFPVYKNNAGYLIKTEKFGIPQRRHRVILLGIRKDIDLNDYTTLQKQKTETTLRQVIGELPKLRSGIGREIVGTNKKGNHIYGKLDNNYSTWKNSISEYQKKFNKEIVNTFVGLTDTDIQGDNYLKIKLKESSNPLFENWYKDKYLEGVLNHEARTHLKEDLGRYLFSSLYLKTKGEFPRLPDYPEWLLPKHKNAKDGDKFADRFRTQKPDQAATTVTSHISKDGHYFIHYDPSQCRSLTVREAARIQTFPDNYYFCGSRTHQYHQVGNAVPPYLAKQLALIVNEILNNVKFK
ncbi:DNA cytosine methyltransferase [Saccharicrinis sp. FJH62]|uniref:DNA cytosine methyltransferase n=1 Tax=Saccharicrinis sp. FJH62 TaxID=3344657 RepID=UPI0035D437A7